MKLNAYLDRHQFENSYENVVNTKITHKDEKIGTPGNVAPASTMKMLPVTYLEESCTKYRISVVNAGLDVP